VTTAALLLDDASNPYQQQLVQEAQARAGQLGVELLPTQFANGSAWDQVESVNAFLRQAQKPDALLVMLAGTLPTRAAMERVPKSGVGLVLLNRVPDWLQEVRDRYPQRLVAGVAPDQVAVGRIQALQAERLAPAGAFVLLVTGTATSAAAIERRRGFLEGVGQRFAVHELDGRWSASGAQAALSSWFQFGARRDERPGLIVCQNDGMAEGVRAALARQAAAAGRRELERVPLVGCDGLAQQGRAMVARGELAATVVMPATTPVALELVKAGASAGAGAGVRLLEPVSFPPLESIRPR
jgi:ABC-type sugar transport system substrate-binding protein